MPSIPCPDCGASMDLALSESSGGRRCPACGWSVVPLGPRKPARETREDRRVASPAPPPRPDAADALPEEWELIRVLGAGGMGVVYRARHRLQLHEAAVKCLQLGKADAEYVERFRREVRAMCALEHPRVVRLLGSGIHRGLPWLAMELVEGPTLRAHLERRPLPPGEALELALQIAQALEYLHSREVVHRDLKPENVLLHPKDGAKVADFGLAKPQVMFRLEDGATRTGVAMGTEGYMAPEARGGLALAGKPADVYALVTLFEMLTGRLPHGDESPGEAMAGLDARLNRLVVSLLSYEPAKRPAASDVVRAFEEILGRGQAAPAVAGAAPPDGQPGLPSQTAGGAVGPGAQPMAGATPAAETAAVRVTGTAGAVRALTLAASLALLAGLAAATGFVRFEDSSHDVLAFLEMPWPHPPETKVVILAVDHDTAVQHEVRAPAKAGPASVPQLDRRLFAAVLRKLRGLGPAVVGVDFTFATTRIPDTDRAFAEEVAAAGKVVLAGTWTREPGTGRWRFSPPLPDFAAAAKGVGFANVPQDADGVIRRVPLRWPPERLDLGSGPPSAVTSPGLDSLALKLVKELLQSSDADWVEGGLLLRHSRGETRVATDDRGRMLLRPLRDASKRPAFPTLSVSTFLTSTDAATLTSLVAGRVVLIGATDARFRDSHRTPLSRLARDRSEEPDTPLTRLQPPEQAGVTIMATVVNSILTNRQLQGASGWPVGLALAALAALHSLWPGRLGPRRHAVRLLLEAGLVAVLGCVAYSHGLLVSVMDAWLGLAGLAAIEAGVALALGRATRR